MKSEAIVQVERCLSGARLAHTYRVADTAVLLARRWGVSEEDAYLAGLLHDIAKQQNPSSLADFGVVVTDQNRALYAAYPRVWHAFAAPILLETLLPGLPESVLDAVQWHTTGTAEMSVLAQVVYVADFIEPGRSRMCLDYVRGLAEEGLPKAIAAIAMYTMIALLKSGDVIHPASYTCLDFYRGQLSHEEAKAIAAVIIG